MSWVYLLKDRGHIFYVLKSFITEIKNQFDVTPKCLRTDNTLKFVHSKVESYYASLVIIHQTIYPHTSQQNGITEKFVQTQTYIRCYSHHHVPHAGSKHLWTDAVLTATYLMNKMSSTPLGGEVPLQHLRPDTNLFTLTPRVFRCLTFIQDLSIVKKVDDYGKYMEIEMVDEAKPNELLRQIVEKVDIISMQSQKSSLNEIFISMVS